MTTPEQSAEAGLGLPNPAHSASAGALGGQSVDDEYAGEPGSHTASKRSQHRHRPRARRGRGKLSMLTVFGEVLVLAGLAIGGYLLWEPWQTSVVVANEQRALAAETAAQWRPEQIETPKAETHEKWEGEIPVTPKVGNGSVFGVLYVPAFSATFTNQLAEGTAMGPVLNNASKGIGRYDTTQMPGETGNFVVAAHRSGPITTPFKEVMNLRIGDPLFVETAEGWYTYRFRSLEYVYDYEIEVLWPFPRVAQDTVSVTDQILTLTTCHPKDWGSAERAIAYAVLDDFQPLSAGPPAELLKYNPEVGEVAS